MRPSSSTLRQNFSDRGNVFVRHRLATNWPSRFPSDTSENNNINNNMPDSGPSRSQVVATHHIPTERRIPNYMYSTCLLNNRARSEVFVQQASSSLTSKPFGPSLTRGANLSSRIADLISDNIHLCLGRRLSYVSTLESLSTLQPLLISRQQGRSISSREVVPRALEETTVHGSSAGEPQRSATLLSDFSVMLLYTVFHLI